MKVAVGSDHAALDMKQLIIEVLEELNIEYKDFGPYSAERVDYPDYAKMVGEAIARGEYDRGILACGTGIGISIAANKIKGIRAALCHDVYSAKMSRLHNNANILTLGARVIGPGPAREIIQVWLETEFMGGRHQVRLDKIAELEDE